MSADGSPLGNKFREEKNDQARGRTQAEATDRI